MAISGDDGSARGFVSVFVYFGQYVESRAFRVTWSQVAVCVALYAFRLVSFVVSTVSLYL